MNKRIKLLVMDVDGTLTDGKINMGPDGELFKAFNIKDGYAINEMLPAHDIVPAIITGRTSQIVENRARELHITELHQGKHDKENVAYIGDDILDIVCMNECALVGCPADACHQVLDIAHFIAPNRGGDGAVRDFIEYIIDYNKSLD